MKHFKKPFIIFFTCILMSCVSKKKYIESKNEHKITMHKLEQLIEDNKMLRSEIALLSNEAEINQDNIVHLSKKNEELQNEINDAHYRYELNERINQLSETEIIYRDIFIEKTDTIVKSSNRIGENNIAFYCPTEMYKGEPYDAYGIIANVISDEIIKQKLVNEIKKHDKEIEDNDLKDEDFFIEKLTFYDMIKLELLPVNTDDLKIKKVHSQAKQSRTQKNKHWHWKITPTSYHQNQQMILKVMLYDEEGTLIIEHSKTYEFEVKVRANKFFYDTIQLFEENQKWAWSSIIIPFITFILGKFQERKKSAQSKVDSKKT